MYYAQINIDGIVEAVTETSEQITADNMVEIDSLNVDLLGKVHMGGGVFVPTPG